MRTLQARNSGASLQAAEHPHRRRYPYLGASVGLRPLALDALIRQVRAGLSFKALERLSATSGLSVAQIAGVMEVPERTLARRRSAGRFTAQESERLLRISRIFEKAVELFEGDVRGAVSWLSQPKRALGSCTPLECLRTELGARQVEDLIGSLEHGVFV